MRSFRLLLDLASDVFPEVLRLRFSVSHTCYIFRP